MTREDFKKHVEQTLEGIIQEAEQRAGRALPRRYCFGYLRPSRAIAEQEEAVEHLTQSVFVDEWHIYPCYDLILGDILEDGRLLFVGYRAGYSPGPWQQNYTGREGPFIPMYSREFLDKIGIHTQDALAQPCVAANPVGALSPQVRPLGRLLVGPVGGTMKPLLVFFTSSWPTALILLVAWEYDPSFSRVPTPGMTVCFALFGFVMALLLVFSVNVLLALAKGKKVKSEKELEVIVVPALEARECDDRMLKLIEIPRTIAFGALLGALCAAAIQHFVK